MSTKTDVTYSGICIGCGIHVAAGVPVPARPKPYRASLDGWGGPKVLVRMVISEAGSVHEIPAQ